VCLCCDTTRCFSDGALAAALVLSWVSRFVQQTTAGGQLIWIKPSALAGAIMISGSLTNFEARMSTAFGRDTSLLANWSLQHMRILVVEDNKELVALLTKALSKAGLDIDAARNAGDADASLRTMHYAAVVLDLGLPDADGLVVLDSIRRRRDQTPVLILSARGGLDDRVTGLHKGASDYLVKPFAMDELVARVQALLRRPPGSEGRVLAMGNVSLDTESRLTRVAGRVCLVPSRESDLLEIFLRRSGLVVSQDVLRGQVFGRAQDVSSNAIEVYVHRLRRLLADAGASIQIHTIRCIGYLMDAKKDAKAVA
jgi:two-component system, OmpR family, response regulator